MRKLEASLQRIWYAGDKLTLTDRLLQAVLILASAMFKLASKLRRLAYRHNFLKSYRAKVPVIIVGNITVGGTGKTACVSELAKALLLAGFKPGIITRGYARKSSQLTPVLVDANTHIDLCGDEAKLLQRTTKCPVVVCANRVKAAKLLEDCVNVIISDDGLQHYALARDIEIACIDGSRKLGNARLLPAGPLREGASRLAEVDIVLTKGEGIVGSESMTYVPRRLRSLTNPMQALTFQSFAKTKRQDVVALAGIANPNHFFNQLASQLLQLDTCLAYPDHANYSQEDFDTLKNKTVVMTEKDAVKCEALSHPDAWYVEMDVVLSEGFLQRILAVLR